MEPQMRSKVTVQARINIMRAFVEMRRFIANNALLFENHAESEHKIFFDGQI